MRIASVDERLRWPGAISLERGDGWVKPWRVPHGDLDLLAPSLAARAELPSGVRLCFETDADGLWVATEPMAGAGMLDVYAGGSFVATVDFEAGDVGLRVEGLPAGTNTVELWLSPSVPFCLRHLDLPDGATVAAHDDARPRWIAYGSSITQCRTARSPSFTWPAIVARARGLHLTSVAYGGNCHADPMVGRLIRDLPADLVSLKIGINVYNQNSLSLRTFRPAVIGLITTIRDGHPDTPLVLCSPIWSPARERTPNAVGLSLQALRDELRETVAAFADRGDGHIRYVDGRSLLGEADEQHLPDGLHPSAAGYELLAANFAREVFGSGSGAISSAPATSAAKG